MYTHKVHRTEKEPVTLQSSPHHGPYAAHKPQVQETSAFTGEKDNEGGKQL